MGNSPPLLVLWIYKFMGKIFLFIFIFSVNNLDKTLKKIEYAFSGCLIIIDVCLWKLIFLKDMEVEGEENSVNRHIL